MNVTANGPRRLALTLAAGALAVACCAVAADREAGLAKTAMCVACHGHDGVSRRPDVPHIAGDPEIYLRQQLQDYRSGKRVHSNMNVVAQSLSDEDIANLAAWYAGLEVTVECPQCP